MRNEVGIAIGGLILATSAATAIVLMPVHRMTGLLVIG